MQPSGLHPIPLAHIGQMLRGLKEEGEKTGGPTLGVFVVPAGDFRMCRDPRRQLRIVSGEGTRTLRIVLQPVLEHGCNQPLFGAEG